MQNTGNQILKSVLKQGILEDLVNTNSLSVLDVLLILGIYKSAVSISNFTQQQRFTNRSIYTVGSALGIASSIIMLSKGKFLSQELGLQQKPDTLLKMSLRFLLNSSNVTGISRLAIKLPLIKELNKIIDFGLNEITKKFNNKINLVSNSNIISLDAAKNLQYEFIIGLFGGLFVPYIVLYYYLKLVRGYTLADYLSKLLTYHLKFVGADVLLKVIVFTIRDYLLGKKSHSHYKQHVFNFDSKILKTFLQEIPKYKQVSSEKIKEVLEGKTFDNILFAIEKFKELIPKEARKNFKLTLYLANYDAIFVTSEKIYFVINQSGSNIDRLDSNEIVAILLHEYAHWYYRHMLPKSFVLAYVYLFSKPVNSTSLSRITINILEGFKYYCIKQYFKFCELQADKFVSLKGYGKYNISALKKLTLYHIRGEYTEENKDTEHGKIIDRINSLKELELFLKAQKIKNKSS